MQCMVSLDLMWRLISGADRGFLEKGFICIKEFRFADFIYLLLNILSETKLFHFHRIYKNTCMCGVQNNSIVETVRLSTVRLSIHNIIMFF